MSEQINLTHLGQELSIVGTVRTENGWEDDLTATGVATEIKTYITTPLPDVSGHGCHVSLYDTQAEVSTVVRFDPSASNVDVL